MKYLRKFETVAPVVDNESKSSSNYSIEPFELGSPKEVVECKIEEKVPDNSSNFLNIFGSRESRESIEIRELRERLDNLSLDINIERIKFYLLGVSSVLSVFSLCLLYNHHNYQKIKNEFSNHTF